MIKSYKEAESAYKSRFSLVNKKNESAQQLYLDARDRYDKANPFMKLFLKEPKQPLVEEESKVDFPIVGQKYAIKYSDIVGPVVSAFYDDEGNVVAEPSEFGREFFDPTHLKVGDISNLWTIVECIGDNKFKDMASGRVFGLPVEARELEQDSLDEKESLLGDPLRIRSSKVISFSKGDGVGPDTTIYSRPISGLLPVLQELTDDVQKSFIEETMPRKDEIVSSLSSLEEQSRENIEAYYAKVGMGQMDTTSDDLADEIEALKTAKSVLEEEHEIEPIKGRSK